MAWSENPSHQAKDFQQPNLYPALSVFYVYLLKIIRTKERIK
ncbi:MAG: hypothetical protein QMC93_01515 [Patescibacteria group bacterium]|nr:hypothetical protein [Patescibacteria group bacterium]